jgi:hypothetical protein
MLYELLTLEPRWAVQDLTKLPVGLAELVQKSTLTEPDQRYQHVNEMREALARVTNRNPQAQRNLHEAIQKISDQNTFASSDIDMLAEWIGLCREESELLHEVAVKIPPPSRLPR